MEDPPETTHGDGGLLLKYVFYYKYLLVLNLMSLFCGLRGRYYIK